MENGKILKNILFLFLFILFMGAIFNFLSIKEDGKKESNMKNEKIILPKPLKESDFSVEEAIEKRRSVRSFKDESMTLQEVSQILWAAQGITEKERGLRSAPSAGATYPLEVYLVVRKVDGLEPGVYYFSPEKHLLEQVVKGEKSLELKESALGQDFIKDASVNVVFTAIYERTKNRYGERGEMYVHMEAGHAAQNIYLQCQSLGLGAVVVGAFNEEEVREIIDAPADEVPLYIIPIGKS